MSNRNNKVRKLNEKMEKAGNMLNSNVTITECVQIARGVAEDVVEDYHRTQGNVQLAISIQLELIKDVLISKGLVTEEEFREKYMQKAQEIRELQAKMQSESHLDEGIPKMKVEAGDVEIRSESRSEGE